MKWPRLSDLAMPVISLLMGLGLALAIAALLGESPWLVASVLVRGSFGSPTDFGYSLYYATPLIFTGLSVAWAFKAGLFNIGAEGQMTLGGLTMAVVGIALPKLPWPLAIPLALLAAFAVGGCWGAIAGWMKAKRGCHEVLTTILLNFIAYGIASFFILSVFKNPDSQVPETALVGEGYKVASMGAALGGTQCRHRGRFIGCIRHRQRGLVRCGYHGLRPFIEIILEGRHMPLRQAAQIGAVAEHGIQQGAVAAGKTLFGQRGAHPLRAGGIEGQRGTLARHGPQNKRFAAKDPGFLPPSA